MIAVIKQLQSWTPLMLYVATVFIVGGAITFIIAGIKSREAVMCLGQLVVAIGIIGIGSCIALDKSASMDTIIVGGAIILGGIWTGWNAKKLVS